MKCGPENCPVMTWPTLSPDEQRSKRKAKAEELYKQNFTMEQIAAMLGVTKMTIARDLDGCNTMLQPPRPKGGRPKGSKKTRPAKGADKIGELRDAGLSAKQIADELGIVQRRVNTVLREEAIRQDTKENAELIDAKTLSMSAQAKLAAVIQREMKRLSAEFEQRVQAEVRQRLDRSVSEIILPKYRKRIADADAVLNRKFRNVIPRTRFRMILAALHEDARKSISEKRLADAFQAFKDLEDILCACSADPVSKLDGLPANLAEWDAAKRAATTSRRAQRSNIVSRR